MEIRVYFEGHRLLRTGFSDFFVELREAAHKAGSRIEFIAAKDGPSVYRKAARTHPNAWNILLKDSEGPHAPNAENVFYMVELMEACFLADRNALKSYYGKDFLENLTGNTANVETVSKADVHDRLKRATARTANGEYEKVKHAPRLLESLNPHLVQDRAPHCKKLFDSVKAKLKA